MCVVGDMFEMEGGEYIVTKTDGVGVEYRMMDTATKSRPRNGPPKQGPKQKATSGPQNRRRRWAQNIIERIFGRWRDGGREGFLLFIYATLCCY
jgi:hypothetical protein